MAKGDAKKVCRTKKLLADTLLKMAETMPVPQISVKDICEACSIQRQSFYYHFNDKYDLVAWIFRQEFEREAERATVLNNVEMMSAMLHSLQDRIWFYRSALLDNNQNNLYSYIIDMYYENSERAICSYLGVEKLDEQLEYDLKSYTYACAVHTKEWIVGREPMSPELFAQRMYKDMPDVLRKAHEVGA